MPECSRVEDREKARRNRYPPAKASTRGLHEANRTESRSFKSDKFPCFYNNRNMVLKGKNPDQVTRYADMFSAMGTESRLRIMQLLLSAHPEGLVVGEIQEELDIPNSTLSHHLDKLKNE